MSNADPVITLNDIAKECGVSRATVSRALRNNSLISAEVTAQVQQVARKMGYRPDPETSRLMGHLKRSQSARFRSTISFLNAYYPAKTMEKDPYTCRWLAGVRARADAFGFALDEAVLGIKGMTPGRLSAILHARGIHGLLIPPEPDPLFQIEMDWSSLAVVASTTTASPLSLHRVLPDNMANMVMLIEHAQALGYQRPGLISWPPLEKRQRHAPTSVYSRYAWCDKQFKALPVLSWNWRDPKSEQGLMNWVKKTEPDLVLAPSPHFYDLLIHHGLSIPDDLGFISYAGVREDVSSLDELPEAIGSAAVDLLSTLITLGEFGLPKKRKTVLIEGTFKPGSSTRQD